MPKEDRIHVEESHLGEFKSEELQGWIEFDPSPDVSVILSEEHEILKEYIWLNTAQVLRVMAQDSEIQSEIGREIKDKLNQVLKFNEELREQMLLTREKIPEIIIVVFSLIFLGFFLFGFLLTPARTFFLFSILGALGLLVPSTLSLFISIKSNKRNKVQ